MSRLGPAAAGFALACLLACLAAPAANAQSTFPVVVHVVSATDDSVDDPPTDAVRRCAPACLTVHYVVRLINCADAEDDGTCNGANAARVTGGDLLARIPVSVPLDCARGVTVSGAGTSDAPTCDPATNRVTLTNVTIDPGGTLLVSFWGNVDCDEGTPWAHVSFDWDQNPTPGRPLAAIDPDFFHREGLIFAVGNPSTSSPTKDAPGLPIPRDQRISDHGIPQSWVIELANPDCSPLNLTQVWDQLDIPECVDVDCSTLRLWIDDFPVALPPGTRCPDGLREFTFAPFVLQPKSRLRITFDSITTDDLGITRCCNLAWFESPETGLVASTDPVLDSRMRPNQTCISYGLAAASRFDGIKIAEDAAGNPIDTVLPGGEVYWRIILENQGNFPATVTLDDEFPPEAIVGAGAIVEPFPSGTCTIAGQHLACTGINLPAFATVEMRVLTPIDCAQVGGGETTCNEAYATVPLLPDTVPTHCPDCIASRPANMTCVRLLAPNFEYTSKTATDADGNGTLAVGEIVTYRIAPLNTGTADGTGVVVRDSAPAATTIVPGSLKLDGMPLTDAADADAGEISGRDVVVRLPAVTPWAFGTSIVTFDARLDPTNETRICNAAATIEWNEARPCGLGPRAIPEACLDTEVVALPPDLSATKAVSPAGEVAPGDVLAYDLRTCNGGAAGLASAVRLTDVIPGGTTYVPGSITLDGAPLTDAADADAGELDPAPAVIVALGDLAPGACRLVHFETRVDGGTSGDVRNRATILADGLPAFDTNDVVTPVAVVVLPPSLTIVKSSSIAGGAPARVGGAITYSLRACNDASAGAAANLVVTDALPADALTGCAAEWVPGSLAIDGVPLTDAADGDGGEWIAAPAPGSVRVAFPALAPGACVDVTFDVLVGGACDDAEELVNAAKLQADVVAAITSLPVTDVVRVDVVPPIPALLRKEGFPLADRCPSFPTLCGCIVGLRLDPVADDCLTAGTCASIDPTTWRIPGELDRRVPLVFYEITGAGCVPAGDPTRLVVSKSPPSDVEVALRR